MLKRLIGILLLLVLACTVLSGCAAVNSGLRELIKQAQPTATVSGGSVPASPAPESPAIQSPALETAVPDANLTLAQIKKAAEDAGYIVSDGHQYILMEDIVGGITIEIVADGAHTLYSIAECGTQEAAAANAKYIDDRGYSISLRNGKFFSSYDAENKGVVRKELLTAILAGKPLPAPPYPEGTKTQDQPEATASPESADGRQEGQGYLADGDMQVTIIGIEKKTLEDQAGVVITYELKNTSEADMDTQGALYVKVEQNYVRLSNPSTYEPAYLTIDRIAPGESLIFYDEYLLENETESVLIEIEEYGSFDFTDPPIIHKTFALK